MRINCCKLTISFESALEGDVQGNMETMLIKTIVTHTFIKESQRSLSNEYENNCTNDDGSIKDVSQRN